MAATKLHPFVRAVARRIAALRQELGLTQEELASKLGIAHKNVQRLESGRQNLTLQTLARVAKVLEVTPAALMASPPAPVSRDTAVPFVRALGPSRHGDAVPLLSLRPAAGAFGSAEFAEIEEWVVPVTQSPAGAGSFVAQIAGTSMEPSIPENSYVLFRTPVRGPLTGRTLLVELRDVDPEAAGRYVVKRVGTIDRKRKTIKVQLLSEAQSHAPLVVDGDDVRFVGEVVEVLGRTR